jgi:hypothetical protein
MATTSYAHISQLYNCTSYTSYDHLHSPSTKLFAVSRACKHHTTYTLKGGGGQVSHPYEHHLKLSFGPTRTTSPELLNLTVCLPSPLFEEHRSIDSKVVNIIQSKTTQELRKQFWWRNLFGMAAYITTLQAHQRRIFWDLTPYILENNDQASRKSLLLPHSGQSKKRNRKVDTRTVWSIISSKNTETFKAQW